MTGARAPVAVLGRDLRGARVDGEVSRQGAGPAAAGACQQNALLHAPLLEGGSRALLHLACNNCPPS